MKLGAGYAPQQSQMNLYHVAGATHGYIGDAPTQLKVEEHVLHISCVTNPLDKVIVTRSDDENCTCRT